MLCKIAHPEIIFLAHAVEGLISLESTLRGASEERSQHHTRRDHLLLKAISDGVRTKNVHRFCRFVGRFVVAIRSVNPHVPAMDNFS